MKKGMLIEVFSWNTSYEKMNPHKNDEEYYGESVDKIFVSRARILRRDERTFIHIMRGTGMMIAREMFCKENNIKTSEVGKWYGFKVIEENLKFS